MGIFPSAGSNGKWGITSQQTTVYSKSKCTIVMEQKRTYIRASVRRWWHIAQLPLGVSRCARTPLPASPWRLCWSSLSSTVLLWSSKEQLVRFCLSLTPEIGFFSLSHPVEWSLVFVCSLASKLWLFLKKKLLPSLMFKWPGPLLPQFLQLTLNHRRPKQHQNQVIPTVILLNNAINHIYLDFWDIFA